jgi:hypothetical protein
MRRCFFPGFLLRRVVPPVLFLTLAGSVLAGPPSSKPDAYGCVAEAEGFLNGRLGLWQQRLDLANWKISILISRATDLKARTLGNIHWDADKKTAVIRVLDPSGYGLACGDVQADMELTLGHELVHLELSSLPRSPASRREEEFAVNRIADALMQLDHQNATLRAGVDGNGRTVALDSKPDTPRSRADASGANTVTK